MTLLTAPDVESSFLGRPTLLERSVLLVALFTYAYSTPFDWFATAGSADRSGPLTQIIFLAFLLNTVVALNGNWHVVASATRREPLIPALFGLILISAMWSNSPVTTFQDGLVLGVTYLTAVHVLVRFTATEILLMLGLVFTAGLLLNAFFVFAIPSQGVDIVNVGTQGGGTWSGVFPVKNALGRASVLGILITGFNIRLRRSYIIWPAVLAGHILLLVGSDSATSFGAAVGLGALTIVFLGFRGRRTLYGATALSMGLVFGVLTVIAATNLAAFTALFGKNDTFTGRLPVWQDTFRYGISERPFQGYGWGQFWVDRESFIVILNANFLITHAHNAFLDAWLFVGPLGPLLLGSIYIRGLVWGARNIRAVPGAEGLFPLLTISAGVIFSLTEAGFVSRSIQFIMLVVAISLAAANKGEPQPFEEPEESHPDNSPQLVRR